MKEKLIIRNFGPIKNVELELGRFNVLIGENATGKSSVAKILSACKYFSFIIGRKRRFIEGLIYLGFEHNYLANEPYIYYDCFHYTFEFSGKFADDSAKLVPKTPEFEQLINELDELNPNHRKSIGLDESSWNIPHSFFRRQQLKDIMKYPLFIPAERGLTSVFALGQKTIENLSESLYDQLDKLTNVISKNFSSKLNIPMLNTTYTNVNGTGYVGISGDTNSIKLSSSATGFQSAIPILLSLNYYYQKKVQKSFIIEEIEINLFPTKQQKLIEELAFFSNIETGFEYLLTTHSPYILTSLNNLMYAYTVGQNHKKEVNKIIEEKYWVNPDEVSAYKLLSDGTCENIFDAESKLIDSIKIDDVSDILSDEFNEIMSIELRK